MYAIVKKVATPPRISLPTVEPRLVIAKKRSNPPCGGRVCVLLTG
jgi:hypothetical protein